jgi:hypothetical protein
MQKLSGLKDAFGELCDMLRKFSFVEKVLTVSEARRLKKIYILKPFSLVGRKAAADLVSDNSHGFLTDEQKSWLALVNNLNENYSVGDIEKIILKYGEAFKESENGAYKADISGVIPQG